MEKENLSWLRTAEKMPAYIKLDGRVYPIDDAISLGKVTDGCLPATRKEYLDYKKKHKVH